MVNQAYGADHADRGFERRQETLRVKFLPRLKSVLAQVPFAPDLLAAYYAVLDRETPMKVRVVLAAALAYFIFPVDVIPDAIVGLGFTDDAAVLYAALRTVSGAIQPRHRAAAERWLNEAKQGA